jgi:sugar/nucleoside kinase (ribokinase family)
MKINGLGCSLVDNLYSPVDFKSESYKKWSSGIPGGIGIITGGLVFGEDLERASGENYKDIIKEITNGKLSPNKNVGGPAIAAMIHIAQMTGQNIDIRFFGARANDENGQYLNNVIESFGINTKAYILTEGSTPFTDVLSDPAFNNNNGERSFINYIGAAGNISGNDIQASFFDSDILIYGGTALTPGLHDDLTYLLKKGRDSACLNFINTVYDFRNQNLNPDNPWPLVNSDYGYKLIDLLITDNEEALKISGRESKKEAIDYFSEKGVHSVIITHGVKEVICYSDGHLFEETGTFYLPVSKSVGLERLNLQNNTEVDTTGCGDNFAGGVYASTVTDLEEGNYIKPSLKKAAAWGVVSGGFAALYQGGVYYENKPGEKKERISALFKQYERQIGEYFG